MQEKKNVLLVQALRLAFSFVILMLYKYYYTVLLFGAYTWKNAKAPVEVDNMPYFIENL